MQIHSLFPDPYSDVIRRFVLSEFPSRTTTSSTDLLELVFTEILGTKQVRYGPKPAPEAQVAIREVIRAKIEHQLPIPFLVAWGSEKPDGSSIDIAELMALRQLASLNERISRHYPPGARFNIRLEDASAPHLFADRPEAWTEAQRYTRAFLNLVSALELHSIHPIPESYLVTPELFAREANRWTEPIEAALRDYEGGFDASAEARLASIGWQGPIPRAARDFYYGQYLKVYPELKAPARVAALARYLAGSLARYKLGTRGDDSSWNGRFLELSFAPPTPGMAARQARRVFYRTLPLDYTSNHIQPWRARGYLRIEEDSSVLPKLASWQDELDLTSHCLVIEWRDQPVRVQADYQLA